MIYKSLIAGSFFLPVLFPLKRGVLPIIYFHTPAAFWASGQKSFRHSAICFRLCHAKNCLPVRINIITAALCATHFCQLAFHFKYTFFLETCRDKVILPIGRDNKIILFLYKFIHILHNLRRFILQTLFFDDSAEICPSFFLGRIGNSHPLQNTVNTIFFPEITHSFTKPRIIRK